MSHSNDSLSSAAGPSSSGLALATTTNVDQQSHFEVLHAVERFLARGGFGRAATALRSEIQQGQLIPRRIDFTGNQHAQSYRDYMESAACEPGELVSLLSRLSHLADSTIPPAVRGLPLRTVAAPRHAMDRHTGCFPRRGVSGLLGRRMQLSDKEAAPIELLSVRELGVRPPRARLPGKEATVELERHFRVLGHLSSVFCVAFDKTGRYVFTGADDNLVKVWDARTGVLRCTLRGHAAEIGDMSVSACNRMLATGSIDKTVRVWNLSNGETIEVFKMHTATVSTVSFLPFVDGNTRYLVSTALDCCINFYQWDASTKKFGEEPTRFNEREQTGTRIVSMTYSPAGTLVVAGDSHHNVHIYHVMADEVWKVQQLAAHVDRVDSLVWAHSGLRFMSGSRDGVARVWSFSCRTWKDTALVVPMNELALAMQQAAASGANNSKNKYRVSMVCWSRDDRVAVTSGSDHVLRLWSPETGAQLGRLGEHSDEAFVLQSHPLHNHIILSAGHDGVLAMWDVNRRVQLKKWQNTVEQRGHAALFDVAMNEDASLLAAVDSNGQLSVFGMGTNQLAKTRPRQQFFHTDYVPLMMDASGWVLDEATGVAPHLMPPPTLIDQDGTPHASELQCLVPGKDGSEEEAAICAWLTRLVVAPLKVEQMEEQAARAAVATQMEEEAILEEERKMEEEHVEEVIVPTKSVQRSNGRRNRLATAAFLLAVPAPVRPDPPVRQPRPAPSRRRAAEEERGEEREGEGGEVREQWSPAESTASSSSSDDADDSDEMTSDTDFSIGSGRRERREREREREENTAPVGSTSRRRQMEEERARRAEQEQRRREEARARRREGTRRSRRNENGSSLSQDSADVDVDVEKGESTADEAGPSRAPQRERERVRQPRQQNKKNAWLHSFPDWMRAVRNARFPYVAQLGDRVVYLKQGHDSYLTAVEAHGLYPVNSKMRPKEVIGVEEYAIVEEVRYTRKPYRLTSVRLARTDANGQRDGMMWTIKYHDMPGLPDFLILKEHYDASVGYRLDAGDAIEAILEDKWYTGVVESKEPKDEAYPRSHWYSLRIKWDTGEDDCISPWDCQPKHAHRRNDQPATPADGVAWAAVRAGDAEWPHDGREAVSQRVLAAIDELRGLDTVAPFTTPVNCDEYPEYPQCIDYPIDLETISERIRNGFYRRLRSLQQEIRYVAINAEQFNEPSSVIVRNARVLVETLVKIAAEAPSVGVVEYYDRMHDLGDEELCEWKRRQWNRSELHELATLAAAAASAGDADDGGEAREGGGGGWVREAGALVDALMRETSARHLLHIGEDNDELFGQTEDLHAIRDSLHKGEIASPHDLVERVQALLQTVRTCVDNKRSPIYRDSISFGGLLESKLDPVLKRYEAAQHMLATMGGGAGSRRLRKREQHVSGYQTRSSDYQQQPSTSQSGRAIAPTGFYRELANGPTIRGELRRMRGEETARREPALREPRERRATRRMQEAIEEEEEEGMIEEPSPQRSRSTRAGSARRERNGRGAADVVEEEEEEEDEEETSRSGRNRRTRNRRDEAERREVQQELQELVDDMEEEHVEEEVQQEEEEEEEGEGSSSEAESTDSEEEAQQRKRAKKRQRQRSSEEEEEESGSPVRNGRQRAGRGSRKRVRSSPPARSGGRSLRTSARRAAVNYDEESEEEETQRVSQRGRLQRRTTRGY